MKKYWMMAAAALMTLAACEEKVEPNPGDGDTTQPEETVDEITVTPEKKTFTQEGGSQKVMVTSTGEWTLKLDETSEKESAAEWISVKDGVESGKDGDFVTFEVKENYTGKQLSAVYVFTCGKAEAKFTAVSESGEPNFLTLASEATVDLKYDAENVKIELNTNLNYRAVEAAVSEEANSWCSLAFPQEGEGDKVNLIFKIGKNEGEQPRSAVITIKGERVEPVTVTISQRAQTKISTDKTEYSFEQDGGTIDVKVISNVEYTFEVTEGADWIKHSQKEVGVETLTAEAFKGKRTGKVTVTEKNPYPGDEPVKLEIVVRQAAASLVTKAIDLTNTRMKPNWEDGNRPGKDYRTKSQFENFTIELLMRADELTKTMSAVFGNKYWLVMFGDNNMDDGEEYKSNQLQISGGQVCATQHGEGQDIEYWSKDVITNDKLVLDSNKWYHLAVTLEKLESAIHGGRSLIKIYVDGNLIHSGISYNNPFNFYQAAFGTFYFGYAETTNPKLSHFKGKLAELRLWEKALTSEELKAKNHFYQVDPKSSGLVAYWKFNEAKMMDAEMAMQYCIPDETGNGFNMICETLSGSSYSSKVAPKLADVNLPE